MCRGASSGSTRPDRNLVLRSRPRLTPDVIRRAAPALLEAAETLTTRLVAERWVAELSVGLQPRARRPRRARGGGGGGRGLDAP